MNSPQNTKYSTLISFFFKCYTLGITKMKSEKSEMFNLWDLVFVIRHLSGGGLHLWSGGRELEHPVSWDCLLTAGLPQPWI